MVDEEHDDRVLALAGGDPGDVALRVDGDRSHPGKGRHEGPKEAQCEALIGPALLHVLRRGEVQRPLSEAVAQEHGVLLVIGGDDLGRGRANLDRGEPGLGELLLLDAGQVARHDDLGGREDAGPLPVAQRGAEELLVLHELLPVAHLEHVDQQRAPSADVLPERLPEFGRHVHVAQQDHGRVAGERRGGSVGGDDVERPVWRGGEVPGIDVVALIHALAGAGEARQEHVEISGQHAVAAVGCELAPDGVVERPVDPQPGGRPAVVLVHQDGQGDEGIERLGVRASVLPEAGQLPAP